MYSGITKKYYRKTAGQEFRKPLGVASVCSENMAVPGEKSFCVLEYHTSKSVVTVQRAFRAN